MEAWWLLQDNAPIHKATLVQKWLHDNGVELLEFPHYSPNLNPIENLWSDLKRRVERRNPTTAQQLEVYAREEWANTSREMLAKLAHSMVTRCKAVVAQRGYMTKY